MTPLQIEILLHYHSRADDYRNGNHSAPAVREALDWFLKEEIIRHEGFTPERFQDGTLKARYALTSRGAAFVEYLTFVPLPMPSWSFGQPPVRYMISPAERATTENMEKTNGNI